MELKMETEDYSAWDLLNNYDLQKNNLTKSTVVDKSSDHDFQKFISKIEGLNISELEKAEEYINSQISYSKVLNRSNVKSYTKAKPQSKAAGKIVKKVQKTRNTKRGRIPKELIDYEIIIMFQDILGDPKLIKRAKDLLAAKKHRMRKTEELSKKNLEIKEKREKLEGLENTHEKNNKILDNALQLILKLSLS